MFLHWSEFRALLHDRTSHKPKRVVQAELVFKFLKILIIYAWVRVSPLFWTDPVTAAIRYTTVPCTRLLTGKMAGSEHQIPIFK